MIDHNNSFWLCKYLKNIIDYLETDSSERTMLYQKNYKEDLHFEWSRYKDFREGTRKILFSFWNMYSIYLCKLQNTYSHVPDVVPVVVPVNWWVLTLSVVLIQLNKKMTLFNPLLSDNRIVPLGTKLWAQVK